jgi:hypothetical protein
LHELLMTDSAQLVTRSGGELSEAVRLCCEMNSSVVLMAFVGVF